jgi:glycosyltransferase involved in cell wall biosynthesis
MRIVIDLQGAQTESRFRGIGRYSLSLALAFVRNRGDHDIHLVLNGILSDTIESVRAAFGGLLPPENIHVWYAPGPVSEIDPANLERRKAAELIREGFIASLNPDIVHISSVIEGYLDDAVTSIARFDTKTPVSVSHYDLIPLLNPAQYLNSSPNYKQHYVGKIDELQRASLVLSISEYSRAEGIEYLSVDESRSVNISTAIDDNFQKLTISPADAAVFLQAMDISKPYIFYTGGSDERKNLPRLVEAFALLPDEVRAQHQLVFAGKIPNEHCNDLSAKGEALGLHPDDMKFLGYVDEQQLVTLYNLCRVFAFPSWHEGFGLPPLEAMACGAAAIGSRASSIPEVLGWDEALFDPYDVRSISAKLLQALEDEDFRNSLIAHGLDQSRIFTWDHCAQTAITAFENFLSAREPEAPTATATASHRKRLAFVSPLPPERTGIAGYAAELLPALHKLYDIELVVYQNEVTDEWAKANCSIRDPQWLLDNSGSLDRVIYQMGNSIFHHHMMELMKLVPGVVVLHDFFLSGLKSYLQDVHISVDAWDEALYFSHGYSALVEKYHGLTPDELRLKYPVNLEIFQQSQGVILHSNYSKELTRHWYGERLAEKCEVIPLLRQPSPPADRGRAKELMGLKSDDFLVCSFGFLDPTKMNHSLLEAWVDSSLAQDPDCKLVFVGDINHDPYLQQLKEIMARAPFPDNIKITGWADVETYNNYLKATDLAVQLRGNSRGETSAAVLDCMNHGAAVIANANGSFAELDPDATIMLADVFETSELKNALELLWTDTVLREKLGTTGAQTIRTRHSPENCAALYFTAIEQQYRNNRYGLDALLRRVFDNSSPTYLANHGVRLADALSQNFPPQRSFKTIYLDITATHVTTLRTGIERVAMAVMMTLLKKTSPSLRIEPVYLCKTNDVWGYKTATKFTLECIGGPSGLMSDQVVIPQQGDVVLTLDWSNDLVNAYEGGYLSHLMNNGVKLYATVFDLLPVLLPQHFPPQAELPSHRWLQATSKLNGVICISRSVAEEYEAWSQTQAIKRKSFSIDWFHLGADLTSTHIDDGQSETVDHSIIDKLVGRPTFLMVGTIEPRKGHLHVLNAFTELWKSGADVNLVIVGKEGWTGVDADSRRNLPEIVASLNSHPERGERLQWLSGVNDTTLQQIYASASCLIFASEGEGFGLPIIEAAQKSLPIIARDLPVFREVAGDNAFYFKNDDPDALQGCVTEWLKLHANNQHPKSTGINWLTWEQSVARLLEVIS